MVCLSVIIIHVARRVAHYKDHVNSTVLLSFSKSTASSFCLHLHLLMWNQFWELSREHTFVIGVVNWLNCVLIRYGRRYK